MQLVDGLKLEFGIRCNEILNCDLRRDVEGAQRCDGHAGLAVVAARRHSHERPFDVERACEVRLDPKSSASRNVGVVNRNDDTRASCAKLNAEWRARRWRKSHEVGAVVHRTTLVVVELTLEADAIAHRSDQKDAGW